MNEKADNDALANPGGCTGYHYQPPNLYLGHTFGWENYALGWLAIVVFLVVFVGLVSRNMSRQKDYISKYNTSLEMQAKAYQELQAITKLLSEISEKLDKR